MPKKTAGFGPPFLFRLDAPCQIVGPMPRRHAWLPPIAAICVAAGLLAKAARGACMGRNNNMARKPGTKMVGEFVLFDVVYEDGSQRSNRRVPAAALGGLDMDEPAHAIIAEQDAEIAAKSGIAPLRIRSVRRAGAKETRAELYRSQRGQ
jgi:hypothetical protein